LIVAGKMCCKFVTRTDILVAATRGAAAVH
jgi:hypothetical protein